ncbi:NEDD4-like E3 ubiquitin-protein ligase WWP1 [Enteropsectra breve]|nr:NEDD4-like E3 ubiquitin-protein ligase WWP1 [Enteropsectra breve]
MFRGPNLVDVKKRAKVKEWAEQHIYSKKKDNYERMANIVIQRQNIVETAMKELFAKIQQIKHSLITVTFADEIGEDYGALRNEFLYLAAEQIFNDPRFTEDDGIYDVKIGCAADASKSLSLNNMNDDTSFFVFVGIVLGLIVEYKEAIPVPLSLAFYENLLERKYTIDHIQNSEYKKGLVMAYGGIAEYSRQELDDIVYNELFVSKKAAYECIRRGFTEIIDVPLHGLTAFDFPYLLNNIYDITAENIKRCTSYENCCPDTEEIQWLWQIIDEKDSEFKRRFVQFVTGSCTIREAAECSSDEGKWYIEKIANCKALLTANTCSKRLFIGKYSSKEEMKKYLEFSIDNTEGFHRI